MASTFVINADKQELVRPSAWLTWELSLAGGVTGALNLRTLPEGCRIIDWIISNITVSDATAHLGILQLATLGALGGALDLQTADLVSRMGTLAGLGATTVVVPAAGDTLQFAEAVTGTATAGVVRVSVLIHREPIGSP